MAHSHDWLNALQELAPDHQPSEALAEFLRHPSLEEHGVLVAGPKVRSPLAERLRANRTLSEEQLEILDEASAYMDEAVDRRLALFADYLAAALQRPARV